MLRDAVRFLRHSIREIFRDGGPVRRVMAPESVVLSTYLLMELPVDRLAWLAKEHGFRLIYLLIPPRQHRPDYELLAGILRRRLDRLGIEYLDFAGPLGGDPPPPPDADVGWLRSLARSVILRDLDNLVLHRHVEKAHESLNYVDYVHPSRKGNRIIADVIYGEIVGSD